MFERIWYLAVKEFIETFRLRRRVFFIFVAPVIQLFMFGYVATMDVNNVSTAWLDYDKSHGEHGARPEARRLRLLHHRCPARLVEEIAPLVDGGKVLWP